ncbi:MAG: glycosyltransferase family 39 protein [Bacteroidia bacterium]|nr:glycosyltransferase family 39 protein [Bacteroidia bacterium]
MLFILSYVIIFLKINAFPLRWWDESLFAENAYELIRTGHYWIPYYEGNVDVFNINKPPLTVWLQSFFIRLFGFHELSVRFHSALFSTVTLYALFVFAARHFGIQMAWISCLILLCSEGFIHFHTSRTGDSDSLLTCFTFLAHLFMFEYVFSKKNIMLVFFFLWMTLAFYSKTISSLFFVPAYLVMVLKAGIKEYFLKRPVFWFSFMAYLCICLMFFPVREYYWSGFCENFIKTEIGKLNHNFTPYDKGFLYYIENFYLGRWSIWFLFPFPGLWIIIKNREKFSDKGRVILLGFGLLVFFYLLIISISSHKMEWYDMPLYPCLAMLAAVPLDVFLREISSGLVKTGILCFLFLFPLYRMFEKSQSNVIPPGKKSSKQRKILFFKE